MWKNMTDLGRPQTIKRRKRNACWITKATNTHSEYVLLTDFPLQQWLLESSSTIRQFLHCPSSLVLQVGRFFTRLSFPGFLQCAVETFRINLCLLLQCYFIIYIRLYRFLVTIYWRNAKGRYVETVYRQKRGLLWRGQCLKWCKMSNKVFIAKVRSCFEQALYVSPKRRT